MHPHLPPLLHLPFKEVKNRVVSASASGCYCHEYRPGLDACNKLACGEISPPQVVTLLRKSSAAGYVARPHPADRSLELHQISVGGWRLEFYFVDSNAVYTRVDKLDRHA